MKIFLRSEGHLGFVARLWLALLIAFRISHCLLIEMTRCAFLPQAETHYGSTLPV